MHKQPSRQTILHVVAYRLTGKPQRSSDRGGQDQCGRTHCLLRARTITTTIPASNASASANTVNFGMLGNDCAGASWLRIAGATVGNGCAAAASPMNAAPPGASDGLSVAGAMSAGPDDVSAGAPEACTGG